MIEFSVSHVRECKGAALSILVLLSMSKIPVTNEWLSRFSGYTDKPIHQALKYLEETGRVTKSRSGWLLADNVQLFLVSDEIIRKNSDYRNNSDNSLSSITTRVNNDLVIDVNNNNSQSRNNSDSGEIWSALERLGVRRNARTERLAVLSHMSVAYILAVSDKLASEGKSGSKHLGLLISSLEKNIPVDIRVEMRGDAVTAEIEKFLGHSLDDQD